MDHQRLYTTVIGIIGIIATFIVIAFIISIQITLRRFVRKSLEITKNYESLKSDLDQQVLKAAIETQENTFQFISKEIHDNISQSLSLVVINLNSLLTLKEFEERVVVTNAIAHLKKTIEDLNNLSKSLDNDLIESYGLVSACQFECDRWNRLYNTSVKFNVIGEIVHHDKTMELFTLRIIQESLNNAIKYSKASEILVNICYYPENIIISIEDNGQGFDLSEIMEKKIIGKHSGIKNMKQRAHMIAGTFEIITSHLKGTKITVDINLEKYEQNFGWSGRRSQIIKERISLDDKLLRRL